MRARAGRAGAASAVPSAPAFSPVLAALLAALLLATVAAPLASAHAEYLDSSPAKGARLQAAPAEVWVRLTERVDPAGTSLRVEDGDGARWDHGDLSIENGPRPVLRVTLRNGTPDGAYLVSWDTLSTVDGHPNPGSFGFAVGDHEPPAPSRNDSVSLGGVAGRALLFAGLALAFGGAAFLLFLRTMPYDLRLALRALTLGSLLHAAGVALLAGSTWSATGLPLPTFFGSTVGQAFALRAGLALAALLLLSRGLVGRPAVRWTGVAALLLAGLASSRLGHLSAHGGARVAIDFLHLLFATAWMGGLLLFVAWVVSRRPPAPDLRAVGLRFGTLALVCVGGVAATGLLSSLALLGKAPLLHPGTLADSPYGRFLAAKVALTAAMVGAAAVNRLRHLAPGGEPAAERGGLATTLGWEAGTGAVVLVLAAFLSSVSPPAVLAAADGGLELHGAGSSFAVDGALSPEPAAGASSAFTFAIRGLATGEAETENTCAPGRTTCVAVELAAAGEEGGEVRFAQPDGEGAWTVEGLLLVSPGPHELRVTVSTAYVPEDRVVLPFTVG